MSNSSNKAKAGPQGAAKRPGKAGAGASKQTLVLIGAGFAVLFAAVVAFTSGKPPPASIGGPFQLTAHTGQQVSDRDFLGRPFLVFFGYTFCPDICHTTLFEMSETFRALGPEAKVGALFVTVDPERDTPEALKNYLANFDSRIIGVTGAREALDPVLRDYRVFAKRVPGEGGAYTVDHVSAVYLMDKNGRFVSTFNVSRKPAEAARDLQRHL